MKALFLIFHGFEEFNGISKKIRYQIKAFKECGVETDICWLNDEYGSKRRMINDSILQDYGSGLKGKIYKRTALNCIFRYIIDNQISFLYIRSDHNTTPFLVNLLRKLKKKGVYIVMEIPTYPYDNEYKGLGLGYKKIILMDKCFRKFMAQYIDKFATFSNHDFIFGRPTIKIANGIDFEVVHLKKDISNSNTLNLVAVATIHPWHGFDRAIQGLINYTPFQKDKKVILHIVGQGVPEVVQYYKQLVIENNLSEFVIFHGPLFGEKLNQVFDQCQIGIGSLARHRSGITHLRSLKNREYAARGIPFVYSEIDDDFEEMPYILKISPDESPLDIKKIIQFYNSINITSLEIRNSISKTLSWKSQMKHVLDEIK